MKLTFLGTRGNIEVRNRRHRMHSSLQVSYYGKKVGFDNQKVSHLIAKK